LGSADPIACDPDAITDVYVHRDLPGLGPPVATQSWCSANGSQNSLAAAPRQRGCDDVPGLVEALDWVVEGIRG
jgi:hypothetical protein